MADMMNKVVLFLAVDGFDATAFKPLWQCFGNLNASTRIASWNADDEIKSQDGSVNTHSDMSFAEATDQPAHVICICDGITANAIKDDAAAQTVFTNAFDSNTPIACVGEGCLALVPAGILNGQQVAAPESLRQQLEQAGATLAGVSMIASDNIFSCLADADLQAFCNMVSDYLTQIREQAA